MQNMPDILTRSFYWLVRFRHRCGYGIHSPFAFGFVTGVIYEQGEYYAYRMLEAMLASQPVQGFREKDLKLLMRLANFCHPRTCLTVGFDDSHPVMAFLKAGSRNTHYSPIQEHADMIVALHEWPEQTERLMAALEEGGMLVVTDIAGDARRRRFWKHLLEHPKAQVSFDLRDFGIIFNRPDLQREHYIVNYY